MPPLTFRDTVPALGIKLPDLAPGAPRSCVVEGHGCHTSFDEAGTDGVDSYVGATQLIGRGLRKAIHAKLKYQIFGIASDVSMQLTQPCLRYLVDNNSKHANNGYISTLTVNGTCT